MFWIFIAIIWVIAVGVGAWLIFHSYPDPDRIDVKRQPYRVPGLLTVGGAIAFNGLLLFGAEAQPRIQAYRRLAEVSTQEQLEALKQKIFGKSSEKMPPIDHSPPRVVSALERFWSLSARTINCLPQRGHWLTCWRTPPSPVE